MTTAPLSSSSSSPEKRPGRRGDRIHVVVMHARGRVRAAGQ
jgi:hypothetical protein